MGFNYALEKKKFDKEWAKTEEEYIAAGMNCSAIEAMREYDWELFKKRRIYSVHEQPMAASSFDDDDSDDSHSSLLSKFLDVMSTTDDASTHHSRYWWVDEIENTAFASVVRNLSEKDIEAITLLVYEGFSQEEVAKLWGVTQQAIAQRIKKVKKFLSDIVF
jgi:RNA polymerase sigma factor (sigma-70 family)